MPFTELAVRGGKGVHTQQMDVQTGFQSRNRDNDDVKLLCDVETIYFEDQSVFAATLVLHVTER